MEDMKEYILQTLNEKLDDEDNLSIYKVNYRAMFAAALYLSIHDSRDTFCEVYDVVSNLAHEYFTQELERRMGEIKKKPAGGHLNRQ